MAGLPYSWKTITVSVLIMRQLIVLRALWENKITSGCYLSVKHSHTFSWTWSQKDFTQVLDLPPDNLGALKKSLSHRMVIIPGLPDSNDMMKRKVICRPILTLYKYAGVITGIVCWTMGKFCLIFQVQYQKVFLVFWV